MNSVSSMSFPTECAIESQPLLKTMSVFCGGVTAAYSGYLYYKSREISRNINNIVNGIRSGRKYKSIEVETQPINATFIKNTRKGIREAVDTTVKTIASSVVSLITLTILSKKVERPCGVFAVVFPFCCNVFPSLDSLRIKLRDSEDSLEFVRREED